MILFYYVLFCPGLYFYCGSTLSEVLFNDYGLGVWSIYQGGILGTVVYELHEVGASWDMKGRFCLRIYPSVFVTRLKREEAIWIGILVYKCFWAPGGKWVMAERWRIPGIE